MCADLESLLITCKMCADLESLLLIRERAREEREVRENVFWYDLDCTSVCTILFSTSVCTILFCTSVCTILFCSDLECLNVCP